MPIQQTVVYTARRIQDADILKNLLAERGIEATVSNRALADGAGVDILGRATAARVVVAERDALAARQIAVEFDRRAAQGSEYSVSEEELQQTAPIFDQWPVCPQCDTRRATRCSICGTAGTDFLVADMGFEWVPAPESPESAASCGCGSSGCGGGKTADQTEPTPEDLESGEPVTLLMCPTCDEPFSPEYANRCTSCGHVFPDGFELPESGPAAEPLTSRTMGVLIALGALAAGAIGYFIWIAQGS